MFFPSTLFYLFIYFGFNFSRIFYAHLICYESEQNLGKEFIFEIYIYK